MRIAPRRRSPHTRRHVAASQPHTPPEAHARIPAPRVGIPRPRDQELPQLWLRRQIAAALHGRMPEHPDERPGAFAIGHEAQLVKEVHTPVTVTLLDSGEIVTLAEATDAAF